MKAAILQHACVRSIAVVILLSGISDVRAHSRKSMKLNETAFAFAEQLIKQGHVIGDRKGAWSEDRPSANEENAFIRQNGFGEYAKWHLGIDDRYPENTKSRYKFSYGDFLVFGRETKGLPENLLAANIDNCITIPMHGTRSLNLATAVGIVLFEAVRQLR